MAQTKFIVNDILEDTKKYSILKCKYIGVMDFLYPDGIIIRVDKNNTKTFKINDNINYIDFNISIIDNPKENKENISKIYNLYHKIKNLINGENK